MANLREWLLEEAEGEPIEAVMLGDMGWGDYGHEDIPEASWAARGRLLSWAEAEPLLSYEFDAGFGAPGCQAVVAWTPTWVIGVSQYDGATRPFRIPRHPTLHNPVMPGG